MGIRLDFDPHGNPQTPTFVLATRNGTKIGQVSNITNVILKGAMKDPSCIFTVNKYDGENVIPYWDDIEDFKLCWCKETDTWFEIKIDLSVSDDVTKQVSLQRLGEAELLQIKVYGMEINTEEDILRDDYVQPTVFYNQSKPTASLLHRILEKAPHYRIRHIDEHLKNIQKIFSFNDKPIKECFDEIEESMDILFVYESKSKDEGTPDRTIDVYDLKSYCKTCGARGSFVDECLNCGSTNITEGYGVDTAIMVSRQALGNEINIKVNADEVKNCYRLEGGDDLMTATIRNCNPNGTSYIWDFAEVTKRDMNASLVEKIEAYKKDYDYYKDSYVSSLSSLPVSSYNALVDKYNPTSEDLKVSKITSIVGYAPIMQHYYDTIDFVVYLESGLLPNIKLQDTNAQAEAAKLTASALSPVAIVSNKYITLANASTAVLNAAKIASDPRYQIKVNQSSLSGNTWTGNFTVTNYSDERDTCVSSIIKVTVNDDYETYVNQKLKKTLYNSAKGRYGNITQMIDMDITTFQAELNKYNLTALKSFNTCFTECINLLSEQGIDKSDSDLYNSVYLPVYNKIGYIQSEIVERENEINVVKTVQNKLLELKQFINNKLNLETYLGTQNWLDFCAYRREDTYSNGNYISDYLNNKELFSRAKEFMEMAEYEISKSANYKHEISSTLKDLLTVEEFKPLVNYFECGNWIRIKDDDDSIYKLRLIDYEIDFDNTDVISVTFSDVIRTIDGLSPISEILVKSSDIINNYKSAINKTNSSFESINDSMYDVITNTNFNNGYINDSYYDIHDSITQNEERVTSQIVKTDTEIRAEVARTYATTKAMIDGDAVAITTSKGYTDSQIEITYDNINLSVDGKINSTTQYFNDTLKNYSTTTEMNSAINIKADSITSTVSATYETKTDAEETRETLSSRIAQTAKSIDLSVTNGETSSGIKITVTKEDGTDAEVSGTIEMTGLVKFTDLSGSGTTEINGANITTGKIKADRIDTNGLYIGWSNLPGSVASTSEIPTNVSELTNDAGYENATGVVSIINGKVTADYVSTLGLEVGTHITMGSNAKISWNNVTEQPTILDSTDVTTITNNTISTTNVIAKNLTVNAVNIDGKLTASQIDADFVTQETIEGYEARIKTIESNYVSTNTLTSNYATISSLNSLSATVDTINSNYITASYINASTICAALNSPNQGTIDVGAVRAGSYAYYTGTSYTTLSLKTVTIDGTTYKLLGA